jgi:hypothetical protein
VIEQDVKALLGISDVLLVLSRCLGLDPLKVCFEDLIDGTRSIRNV